ncbi:hypothetical protein C346_00926 [Cryptococcus neoformans D17-1]|nr:hypothetical protein C346_00926 [Cryptococcus neoformans var. grubii D17-1]
MSSIHRNPSSKERNKLLETLKLGSSSSSYLDGAL